MRTFVLTLHMYYAYVVLGCIVFYKFACTRMRVGSVEVEGNGTEAEIDEELREREGE
jgi:hypothetical protein